MALIIRPSIKSDVPALGRLGALLVKTHYDFDEKRFMAPSPHTPKGYGAFLVSQIEDNEKIVLVAEEDEAVVGYVYAGMEDTDYMALRGPAGALYDIVVDPAHRGKGIGRRLLDEALEFLKDRGAPRVVLSSATKNEPAQRLFAGAGFRSTMIEMTRELP